MIEGFRLGVFSRGVTLWDGLDFAFGEAGESKHVHVTFFGGETLLNAKVLRSTVRYARDRAVEMGEQYDRSDDQP